MRARHRLSKLLLRRGIVYAGGQAWTGAHDRWLRAQRFDSLATSPVVRRLCCLRGVSALTGFALATEIGDWHRFTGKSIGSFVGLVPSEHSSATSRVHEGGDGGVWRAR